MGLDMHLVLRLNYMDMQIRIGDEVPKIEKAPQDVVLVWDQSRSLGLVEGRPILHLV